MESFCFGLVPASAGNFVARVPATVGKAGLILTVLNALEAPCGSGRNWDALFDVLCDLSWVDQHDVVLFHEGLPDLVVDDLRVYLKLLAGAAGRWAGCGRCAVRHQLAIYFPASARAVVEGVVAFA